MAEGSDDLDDFLNSLRGMDDIGDDDITALKEMVSGKKEPDLPKEFLEPEDGQSSLPQKAGPPDEESVVDLRAKIADMRIPEKIKLAMFGNSTCRFLLIFDSSRTVQDAVIKNPRLTPGEIETFSKNSNISDHVLRQISNERSWVKDYMVKRNLVTNPKTPSDIALKWLRYLRKSDLRIIAKSKNLPNLISVTARKLIAAMEKRK